MTTIASGQVRGNEASAQMISQPEGTIATRKVKEAKQSILSSLLGKISGLFKSALSFIQKANSEENPSIKQKTVKEIKEGKGEDSCIAACCDLCCGCCKFCVFVLSTLK